MASELLRELRTRVDAAVKPHRDIYGPDAPVVRMALRILAEAEEIDEQLRERRVTTAEAAERTGWSVDTLQHHARRKLDGEPMPAAWAGLIVERAGGAYVFVVGSIPAKAAA